MPSFKILEDCLKFLEDQQQPIKKDFMSKGDNTYAIFYRYIDENGEEKKYYEFLEKDGDYVYDFLDAEKICKTLPIKRDDGVFVLCKVVGEFQNQMVKV